ncbi:hypothetical protein BDN71DRAFT_725058 [Pleurotus eryngii]|uniref:Glucose-methanol-choline oxidoreductase N-terminal domain-containing protein n=1 Tax=Pleurotus eryngii TaxID=5323 RepID=A0A9P6DK99_PLEER|nr:hypothetical protein BDN71DRAFT_725058 [Pleurotus eryngii]
MLRWLGLSAVVLVVVSCFAHGKVLRTASEMSPNYDFVVVGGGTAGYVIAYRLTEDPKFEYWSPNPVDRLFRNYTTTPQATPAGRSIPYIRGHILGGCSSISDSRNGMTFTKGSAEDYNKIANITGDKGWSWNRLQHYIKKFCCLPMFYDPSVHGFHGITELTLSRLPYSIDDIMFNKETRNSPSTSIMTLENLWALVTLNN